MIVGPDLSLQGGVSQVIRLNLLYPPHDVDYLHIPTVTQRNASSHVPPRHPLYYWQAIRNLRFLASALQQVKRQASTVDLAHLHIAVRGSTLRKYLVSRILTKHRIPYILHNHGGHYDAFFYSLPRPLQNAVRDLFLKARGTIVITKSWVDIQSKIVNFNKYPIYLLYNPIIMPKELNPKLDNNPNDPILRLLFLGRLGPHKGSDRVLKAIALLPPALRCKVRVYMAGDAAVEEMRALAHQLGIADIAEIRDWIGEEVKTRWLQETNAFILPSHSEGLPMSLLEAMAWGKAVIVSPVGGIPELVDDGCEGFLVPADDVQAIADAIRRLVEAPDLRSRMGLSAWKRIKPLDIQDHRRRLGEIYSEALRVASAPR